MFAALGLVIILFCVFGGYTFAGGKMSIILHSLPFELMIIGGGSIGAMVVGNKGVVLKKMGGTFKRVISGPIWHKSDYRDLLCLLYTLAKTIRSKGMISLEQHIEEPKESTIFSQYPRILAHEFSMELICDTLRTISMGVENPHEIENVLEKKIEKYEHEVSYAAHSLQTMADGLPAIGIVAAVLGVIKTMASINEPPEVLGAMIGGALVGTFLGVFLAYCMVGPFAQRAQQALDEEAHFYLIIKDVLVGHLNSMAPVISMEIGRGNVPTHYQPSFLEMEQVTGEITV